MLTLFYMKLKKFYLKIYPIKHLFFLILITFFIAFDIASKK